MTGDKQPLDHEMMNMPAARKQSNLCVYLIALRIDVQQFSHDIINVFGWWRGTVRSAQVSALDVRFQCGANCSQQSNSQTSISSVSNSQQIVAAKDGCERHITHLLPVKTC